MIPAGSLIPVFFLFVNHRRDFGWWRSGCCPFMFAGPSRVSVGCFPPARLNLVQFLGVSWSFKLSHFITFAVSWVGKNSPSFRLARLFPRLASIFLLLSSVPNSLAPLEHDLS